MEWVDEFMDIGIEDVHRLDLIVPSEDVDVALLRMLQELKFQASKTTLTPQEESDLSPVMTLFNTLSILMKHKPDFIPYMEACMSGILQAWAGKIFGHR